MIPRSQFDIRHARSGFTLVELLVTTSLMALVGGAAVAALSGGVRVWERAAAYGVQQQSSLLAFDQLRRDLQNVRTFTSVPFDGVYNQCSFAAVEHEKPTDDLPGEIGRLGYFLDERRGLLCRSFVPYRLMKRYRLTERCQPVLEGATRVRFSYYGAEEEGGTPDWHEHWKLPTPPLAIKSEFVVQVNTQQATTHSFVIALTSRTSFVEPPEPK